MFENMRSRRNLLRSTAIFAGGLLASLGPVGRVWAAPVFINDPFQLGVASGDPVPDGFVIWTRLAPDLFDPQALPNEAIVVNWEVAADDKMKKTVMRGQVYARPELGHSVHVDVMGLQPGREYFYRFTCGAAVSPVGRALTLPTPTDSPDRLKFALACCQHFQQGYFTAYRDMIAQDPNLIVHVGDYIYEVSYGVTVRQYPVNYARSLEEYRLLHGVYKTDPDLQAAHRHCPWIFTWDDHEVDNDYARNNSQFGEDPVEFEKRRLAAYQAYYEHIPLRAQARRNANGDMILYQRLNYGNLLEFNVLDLRQWRSNQACESPDWMSGRVLNVADCPEFADPARTMLGKDQERWMQMQFAKTGAKWTVLVHSLMLSAFDQVNGPGTGYYTDNWSGYQVARRKVLDLIKARKPANVVSLGVGLLGAGLRKRKS